MAVNKVVYGDQTIIDLTDSTLSSGDQILSGTTAYDRSGVLRSGTAQVGTKVYDGDSTADTPYDNLFMDTVASGVESLIVGGVELKKIYENGTPTSTFAGQTLSNSSILTDIADYDYFICEMRRATGTDYEALMSVLITKKSTKYNITGNAGGTMRYRDVTITEGTGITFSDCTKLATYGASSSITTDNSCLIPMFVYGIKSATAISTSLQHIFPNYNVSQTLNSGSSSGTTTFTGMITEAGYLQARINVTATAGNNFVRVKINGSTIWEKQDKVSQNYVYTWSPMFYVKAGDTYSVELDSGSGSCNKYVYFYGLR